MSWQRVECDEYDKMFIAFVFDELPLQIHQVGLQFDFIGDENEILFTDVRECSETDTRFLCDTQDFEATKILRLTVNRVYGSYHDGKYNYEITQDKWGQYGFI